MWFFSRASKASQKIVLPQLFSWVEKAKFEKQFLENKNVQQAFFLVIFPNSLKWNFPCFWQSRPAQNFAFLKMLFFGIFTKKLDERAKTPNELFHMWWEGTHFLKQKTPKKFVS